MDIHIRSLMGPDFAHGFLETLASLAEVDLDLNEAVEIFRKRLHAGLKTYVAEFGDQVVGTATLLIEQKFIHAGGRVAHIEDVAIRQGYQRMGLGAALVRHLVEEAQNAGCYKVILDCSENLVPFYEELGFLSHNVGMRLDLVDALQSAAPTHEEFESAASRPVPD